MEKVTVYELLRFIPCHFSRVRKTRLCRYLMEWPACFLRDSLVFVVLSSERVPLIGFVLHQYAKSNQIMSARIAYDMKMCFPFSDDDFFGIIYAR